MTAMRDLIRESRIIDLGPLPAPRLAPGATVKQAVEQLSRGRRGAVVAVEGLTPVGIFTERDMLFRVGELVSPEVRRHTKLRDVMSRPAVCVRRQITLHEAIETMDGNGHRHLVLVDREGDLRGMLTTNDLVQFVVDQFPEEILNLPPRLHQVYRSPGGA